MTRTRTLVATALFLSLLAALGPAGSAAKEGTAAAAQARPAAASATVTTDDMAKAIKGYIDTDMALKGGYFLVWDPVQKKTLELTLDRIHLDKLAKVAAALYFACCDFKATDGNVYDLDFFMKGQAMPLAVSEITVHKDNGVPRYGWEETDGVWHKVPVKK